MINIFGCGRTKAPTSSMRDRVYLLELNFRCNPTIQYSICTGKSMYSGKISERFRTSGGNWM